MLDIELLLDKLTSCSNYLKRNTINLLEQSGCYKAIMDIAFLFRDEFITADAPPITTPRTAEPGPGILSFVGGTNSSFISGGRLLFFGDGSQGFWSQDSYARTDGLAFAFLFRNPNLDATPIQVAIGLHSAQALTANVHRGIYIDVAATKHSLNIINGQIGPDVGVDSDHWFAVVVYSNYALYLWYEVSVATWKVLFRLHGVVANPLYITGAALEVSVKQLDNITLVQLPAPFTTPAGISTTFLSGNRNAGDVFVHEANALISFTVTIVPSAGTVEIRFRIQDISNYWQLTIDSAGAVNLDEVVVGIPTTQASFVGVVGNGERILIKCNEATIDVYESVDGVLGNNPRQINYTNANNFQTATSGEIEALGTGGVVTDLIVDPYILGSSLESILNTYFEI